MGNLQRTEQQQKMERAFKTFHVIRLKDISGVSGIGRVAEGIVFHDGQTVISWFGQLHSIAIYPDVMTMLHIHGHEGSTIIEWVDMEEVPTA